MFFTMKIVYKIFRVFARHLWAEVPFVWTNNSQFVLNYLSMAPLRAIKMKKHTVSTIGSIAR